MFFPFKKDLENYSWKGFKADLLAALTLSVILVPQGLAYAYLAGLEPIYGLYGSIIPLLIYPLIGTSRFLSVGPVAIIAILILAGASSFAQPGTEEYLHVVLMLALLSGILQVLFSIFRLGSLSNYLAKPVLNGFVSAAAIMIIASQITNITSVKVDRSSTFITMMNNAFSTIADANMYSVILGISALLLIPLLKKWNNAIPGALIAAVLGIACVYFLNLDIKGVPIIGELPSGLPYFKGDFISFELIMDLLPSAFVISLVCFISSYSIAKSFESDQYNRINANRELMALGIAKVVGSFFLSMPSSSSFSRSAINAEAKIHSSISSYLLALILGLVLLFFGFAFHYLPYPILAAIIIVSVFGLIKFSYAEKLWKFDRRDFYIFLLTFFLTLSFGIIKGILIGVGLSLFAVLHRMSNPNYAILGRLPGTNSFRNIERYKEANPINGNLIIRYDQDLFFGNMDHFYDSMTNELKIRAKEINKLVLHFGSIQSMDSAAMERICDLEEYCKGKSIKLQFTNISGPLRDLFKKNKWYDRLGRDSFHLDVAHALSLQDETSDYLDAHLSAKYSSQVSPDV